MARDWIWFDRLVADFRYARVNRYVQEGSVIADIGCGREGAFLDDPAGVLLEAARIVHSGGRIIMTTPTRIAKPVLEFLSFKLHLINEDEIREHKHYFTKNDVKALSNLSMPK